MGLRDRAPGVDAGLAAQAARIAGLAGAPPMPRSRTQAGDPPGVVVAAGDAAALVEVVTWLAGGAGGLDLGDRTAHVHLVALPDPAAPYCADAVAGLVDGIRGFVRRLPGQDGCLRTRVSLRWPEADTGMHPHWARAGLVVEGVRGFRSLAGLRSGSAGVTVRRARPADVEAIAGRCGDGPRSPVLTPFTREVPPGPFVEAAVRARVPTRPVFVVERDGEVLGYAMCRVGATADAAPGRRSSAGRTVHLVSVGLREDAHGAGPVLVAGIAADLARRGVVGCSAEYVPADPVARRFWTALGLRPVWRHYAAVL